VSAPFTVTPNEVVEPVIEEVAPGVFAYLQLYGQWGLNNAGFIVGDRRTVAIDTCFTVRRSEAFKKQTQKLSTLPCATVLNTHHHGDHTYGNFLFPEATIIGHALCREEMLKEGLRSTSLFQEGVDWGDIEVDPPFVTFEDRLTIYAGEQRIEAIFVGPAHTTNDVVYYLPDHRLLFAGDVAFAGGTPFAVMGSVRGSLTACEKLRHLEVDTVVPGHGPLCGPEIFDEMSEYLTWVQGVAGDAYASGTSPLDAARSLDLGKFAGWHDSERLAGNLHRAMAERGGTIPGGEIDLQAALADMVTLNDGRPLQCMA
jgi:cyclase